MESKKKHAPTFTAELHECGVRLYREYRYDYTSYKAAYRAVATGLWPIKKSSKVPSYARAHGGTRTPTSELLLGDKIGDKTNIIPIKYM